MQYLKGNDEKIALNYFEEAKKVAQKSLCLRSERSKCGVVIVKDGKIIGSGYTAPPLDDISKRKCKNNYSKKDEPKYDTTCCVHAEWRAITDALKNYPKEIAHSSLYFIRVDTNDKNLFSGRPFCTSCSRLALDNLIGYFYLYTKDGVAMYDTDEYNEISYSYFE